MRYRLGDLCVTGGNSRGWDLKKEVNDFTYSALGFKKLSGKQLLWELRESFG